MQTGHPIIIPRWALDFDVLKNIDVAEGGVVQRPELVAAVDAARDVEPGDVASGGDEVADETYIQVIATGGEGGSWGG